MDFTIEFRKLDMTMGDDLLRSAKSCPCHLGGDKILTATTSTTTTTTRSTTTTSTTTTTRTSTTMAISTTTIAPSTTTTIKTTSPTTTAVTASSTTSIQLSSTTLTTQPISTTLQSTTDISMSKTPQSTTSLTGASTSVASTTSTSTTAVFTTTTVKEVVIAATQTKMEIKLDTTIPWSNAYLDQGSDDFGVLETLVANLIDTAFVDEETPEYFFIPSSGTSGVTINLTLIVTVADEDQVMPESSQETFARKAARSGVVTLRNFNFNLESFLENLETAVEESEVFENIGKLEFQQNSFDYEKGFLKLF